MTFKPYSSSDLAVIAHPQYPRVTTVFHEVPERYRSGRLRHRTTCRNVSKVLGKPANYKQMQYASECMRTFRCIPDYVVFSASQYAKIHNISHVTAKKRLKMFSFDITSGILQITNKYFVKANSPLARQFIVNVMYKYNANAANYNHKTLKKLQLPQILKALQKLKDFSLTHNHAFYQTIASVVNQPVLSWLISAKIVARIQLDFLGKRGSVVYLRYPR